MINFKPVPVELPLVGELRELGFECWARYPAAITVTGWKQTCMGAPVTVGPAYKERTIQTWVPDLNGSAFISEIVAKRGPFLPKNSFFQLTDPGPQEIRRSIPMFAEPAKPAQKSVPGLIIGVTVNDDADVRTIAKIIFEIWRESATICDELFKRVNAEVELKVLAEVN